MFIFQSQTLKEFSENSFYFIEGLISKRASIIFQYNLYFKIMVIKHIVYRPAAGQ
jgi:hypothetical protein